MHDELDCSVASPEQAELVAQLGREAVKLEVPMQVELKFGRSWGDAKHTWEELHRDRAGRNQGRASSTARWRSGGSQYQGIPEFRSRRAPQRSETEHNLECAETDVATDRSSHLRAMPARSAGWAEQQRQLSAGESLARREDAFIRRRMAEEGIAPSLPLRPRSPGLHPLRRRRGGSMVAPAAASAAGDRAHPAHQGRRAAHQADLAGCRRHAGEGRLGLRDGPRHGRARHGCRRRCARRVDRRPDAVTGARARHACARTCPTRSRSPPRRCWSMASARPDLIARTGANIVYHGPAFALLDFDTKGMPASVAAELQARRRLLAGAADGAAGPGRRGAADAELDQRRPVAHRYRGSDAGLGRRPRLCRGEGRRRQRAIPASAARPLLAGRVWAG